MTWKKNNKFGVNTRPFTYLGCNKPTPFFFIFFETFPKSVCLTNRIWLTIDFITEATRLNFQQQQCCCGAVEFGVLWEDLENYRFFVTTEQAVKNSNRIKLSSRFSSCRGSKHNFLMTKIQQKMCLIQTVFPSNMLIQSRTNKLVLNSI